MPFHFSCISDRFAPLYVVCVVKSLTEDNYLSVYFDVALVKHILSECKKQTDLDLANEPENF